VIIGQNLGHQFANMEKLSEKLRGVGVQRVIFTGPSPHWVPNLPVVLARMIPNVPERTYLGVDKGVIELDLKLKKSANQSDLVEYVSLIDFYCNNDGCLTHYLKDVAAGVTSWDYGHLTPLASHQLAKDLLAPIVINKN
jgi:hypothetical protein